MYGISQLVIYGIHGVCKILDIETRTVDRKEISYYVLEPHAQPGTRYYIPCHNPAATAKMRPLLSKSEIQNLLAASNGTEAWISDENRRKQLYRQLITSADPQELLKMIRCLHQQRESLRNTGKRLHLCDENFLRDAEHILVREFALVLEISDAEVAAFF